MVGDILRQEREKKNLSIQDVEAETSIRALYITSIEEGNYEAVPGEVYLRGFIKTYAKFLQLDGAELLEAYNREKMPAPPAIEETAAPLETPTPLAEAKAMDHMSVQEKRAARKKESGSLAKIAAGVLVLLCVGGVGFWAFGGESKAEPPATANEAKSAPKAASAPPKAAPPAAKPTEKPAVPPASAATPTVAPLEVQAKYTANCWTQVKADGKIVYEATTQDGAVLTWKAEKSLELTFGNAGAVELISGGKSLGKLGANGEVVIKEFSRTADAKTKN